MHICMHGTRCMRCTTHLVVLLPAMRSVTSILARTRTRACIEAHTHTRMHAAHTHVHMY